MSVKYQRVVLKLSGEALAGKKGFGINPPVIASIAQQIKKIHDLDVEVAIVCGGGNIWRGETGAEMGMERSQADYIGMLATVMRQIAEPYIRRKAIRHLEKKRVVIFAAGTGSPYFSTDTTAVLRAAEIDADVILMAKNGVDGVYSADPQVDPTATKYDELTQLDVINKNLGVMDSTASSLSMDNDIPLVVFNLNETDNILRVVQGEQIGTTIKGGKNSD